MSQVISVSYYENGVRTVFVDCQCGESHEVAWPQDTLALAGELPCGKTLERLQVPAWCFGHRTGYAKYQHREHPVVDDELRTHAAEPNDNASGEYEHNWIE
jgi:hypothetical protein